MSGRRRSADERKEQLLDACAAIVDVEGFHAVSIERVATDCGVSRTLVYQLFGNLDALLDALVDRAGRRAGEAVTDASTATGSASLEDAMATILAAVDRDPTTWRMFLVAPTVGPASLVERLESGRAMIRHHNIAAVERNGVRSSDPELTARLLQVIADELVRLRLADPALYTVPRLTASFVQAARSLIIDAEVAADAIRRPTA